MTYNDIKVGYLYEESLETTLIWYCFKEEYNEGVQEKHLKTVNIPESIPGLISEGNSVGTRIREIGHGNDHPEYLL